MGCSERRKLGIAAVSMMAAVIGMGLPIAVSQPIISTPRTSIGCPSGYPVGLPCPQQAWETVALEHADRMKRLRRLAADRLPFEFHEEWISPAEHGIPGFPVAIPVLRVIAGQNVFFDRDRDEIRPEAYPLLDIIADSLKREPPDVTLFVAGHTDSDGSDAYNVQLGHRRAASVSEALARRGIYQSAIYRVSFGRSMPIDDNGTEAGKARNRRVEFLFSARRQAIVEYLKHQAIPYCSENVGSGNRQCSIDAERVFVDPVHRQAIEKIDQRDRAIKSNPSLTKVELKEEERRNELDRNRIPIVIKEEHIPIDLGRRP